MAPLIIFPKAGYSLTKSMKNICKNFLKDTNIDVKLVTIGGSKMTRDVKSNPYSRGLEHEKDLENECEKNRFVSVAAFSMEAVEWISRYILIILR